jgi:glycosyltransferase involved in cell wall biosynthesis
MRIVLDLQGAQSDSRFRGIGRYSVSLAKAIVKKASNHEVWLALSGLYPETAASLRDEFADLIPRERIRTFELPGPVAELDPQNSWRMQSAELVREKFLSDLRPDVVHVSSMFEGFHNEVVTSVGRLQSDMPTAVTLYDLIPLLHPETFLADAAMKRCYLRRVQSLINADLLLAISESSRREAIEMLQIRPDRITTIGAGVSSWFRPENVSEESREALLPKFGLRKPFILSAGTVDPNKNLGALIEAFGLLPDMVRATHQLAIAGKFTEEDCQLLLSRLPKSLAADTVRFTGYVSDEDLRLLYQTCALFVLPSLHEGFGLPLVEAMACGAPVIGSDCTSIPEIIDRPEALFDPHKPEAIANSIQKVLSDAVLRDSIQEWGQQRSKLFTWESCAQKAIAAFEKLYSECREIQRVSFFPSLDRRLTLAFVSPLPPDETSIANYAGKLLPLLARYYEVICISDQPQNVSEWIAADFQVRNLDWFKQHAHRFERILHQFGNSLSCRHLFNLILEYPGIVELHDLFIGDLLNQIDGTGDSPGAFVCALYDGHGFTALKRDQEQGRETSIRDYASNAQVFKASIGVIVHSEDPSSTLAGVPDNASENLCWRIGAHQTSSIEPFQLLNEYVRTIERFYAEGANAWEGRLLARIANISVPAHPSDTDLAKTAAGIASNRDRIGQRQLLVDVTNIAQGDIQTGIQRVTRALLSTLIKEPPAGFRVEPVRIESNRYFYARRFACRFLGLPDQYLTDDAAEIVNGDIFLGVEWGGVVPRMKPWFLKERARGLQVYFLVYDLLAILRPEFFPPGFESLALSWIETIVEVADGIACISKTVAEEVFNWCQRTNPDRGRPMEIGHFHLGADLSSSVPTKGLPENVEEILAKLAARPTFLSVGTLEPRKGHRLVFAAMEQLWESEIDANWVIVGKLGWNMDDLAQRMRRHKEYQNRLLWLSGASDEMLHLLYRKSTALIAASECEGFGLPIIEAAQYGLPIIARDIPIFREVAGEHAFYFDGSSAEPLANALRAWLTLGKNVPKSDSIKPFTWQQSSQELVDIVMGRRPYLHWPAERHRG